MDYAANLVLTKDSDIQAIKNELDDYLTDRLSGGITSDRGSRQKLVTILLNIWLKHPDERRDFCQDAYKLLKTTHRTDWIVIYWGMTSTAYPFWADVAKNVGRLFNLQGQLTNLQVYRRLHELYGDREIVSRATRSVVRSFVDWGLLRQTGKKGVYTKELPCEIEKSELVSWLIEALLYNKEYNSSSISEIYVNPQLFPFKIRNLSPQQLIDGSSRIEIFQHGLDDKLIRLTGK